MNNKITKLFSLLVTVFMVFSATSPVFAQDTDLASVLTSINEANQNVPSMAGDATMGFSVSDSTGELAGLDASGNFQFNVDPRFSLQLDGDATVRELVEQYNEDGTVGETQVQEDSIAGSVVVVDGILYANDGTQWQSEDISEEEQEASEQFYATMEEVQSQQVEVTDETVQLYEKYFDISETETDYVFALKPDINPEEFWADMETLSGVDLDAIKQQGLDEAISQAEAQGVEMTEEDIALYSQMYDLIFSIFFTVYDNVSVSYSKENFYITNLTLDLSLNQDDIAEMLGASPEEMGDEQIEIVFNLVANFTNHGEQFDIQAPADAPAPAESTETISEESAPASDESVESETSEETTEESSTPEESVSSEESVQ